MQRHEDRIAPIYLSFKVSHKKPPFYFYITEEERKQKLEIIVLIHWPIASEDKLIEPQDRQIEQHDTIIMPPHEIIALAIWHIVGGDLLIEQQDTLIEHLPKIIVLTTLIVVSKERQIEQKDGLIEQTLFEKNTKSTYWMGIVGYKQVAAKKYTPPAFPSKQNE